MITREIRAKRQLLNKLADSAWQVRGKAFLYGPTAVGCALISKEGIIATGCNIEHRFRSHDIHAEVNAISSMISLGGSRISIIVIAAERKQFTPCGACMDWIMQFAESDCVIGFQSTPNSEIKLYTAKELMPFYPE